MPSPLKPAVKQQLLLMDVILLQEILALDTHTHTHTHTHTALTFISCMAFGTRYKLF
jgi:hypothetical protein